MQRDTGHRLDQQIPVQEKIPRLAACFGEQQTAVAGGAVGSPVAGMAIRFMIGANRVIGTDFGAS
jgi:hypothetical protein